MQNTNTITKMFSLICLGQLVAIIMILSMGMKLKDIIYNIVLMGITISIYLIVLIIRKYSRTKNDENNI